MDDLANYVMAVTNYGFRFRYDPAAPDKPPTVIERYVRWYTPSNSSFGLGFALTNGSRIIGLLSTPKYLPTGTGFYSNYVFAVVRSLSGNVSDLFPQTNAALQDLAFSYRMISEVIPYGTDTNNLSWVPPNLQSNLHEVRLTFRWPPAAGPKAARQVYRAAVGGSLVQTNEPQMPTAPLFFLDPGTYVQARIP